PTFTCQTAANHKHLTPFPTRRSSDLAAERFDRQVCAVEAALHIVAEELAQLRFEAEPAEHLVTDYRAEGFRIIQLTADHAARLRSEEHTSELQSRENLVCRLLLVK